MTSGIWPAREMAGMDFADDRLAGLLEAVPDAIVCVDGGGRILLVNGQAERLFGYSRDELLHQPVEMLVPEAARDIHRGYRAGYLADPRPRPMGTAADLTGRRKDGTTFPAEIALSAMGTGEGLLVTAAVRDVSERLEILAERDRMRARAERSKLEEQLKQAQRLESLGQLAGGVAHDFNNLLGVISNYAAFAADDVTRELTPARRQDVQEDITQIRRAAQQAAGLTQQLLAFARHEIIQPRVLNLNDVVTGVEHLLVRTLGEHIELITDLAGGLSPVLADPGQIEQVLINLAVNARDAMPGGGKLTIQTANTAMDGAAAGQAHLPPGQYVAVKVTDTGTGMSREVLDQAFDLFFTTKAKDEGSGLGLASVHGIITQAGGRAQIRSEPGLGTTVTVLLPVTAQAAQDVPSPPTEDHRGHGETVLVAEDEPAMREVTRRILARNGYHVVAVASGREALAALATRLEGIDVLLTDVVMPQMQGKELADKVRVLQPAARVLYMSGYTQGLLGSQGVLEPGSHLIEKPFSETSLLSEMHAILSTHD